MTYDERRVHNDGAGCQHGTEVYKHEPYRHYCMDCGADLDEIMDLAGLQADLDELEATDPIVKAAAASYANMVARITGAQRSEVDFYEDDEDPQAIRAVFDRGPHGVTGSGGARLMCGNGFAEGGFVESHKDCRAALDAAQDEIERCIADREALREQVEDLRRRLADPESHRTHLAGNRRCLVTARDVLAEIEQRADLAKRDESLIWLGDHDEALKLDAALRRACEVLGLTRSEYVARYGWSKSAAVRAITEALGGGGA